MDTAAKIAQFENMTQADPENEMAHFSLGSAYQQAGRFSEAAGAFLNCIQRAPAMSKAYQLAAENFLLAGDAAKAGEVATKGFVVAEGRGDRLPMAALESILRKLNIAIPSRKSETAGADGGRAEAGHGGFVCRRTGRSGTKMERPPFKGPIGSWIHRHIARETWTSWIGQGTKVINELRLDLSRDEDSETYDQHMREYLGIDDSVMDEINAGR